MPQITVDYSPELSQSFDRRGFALALHRAAGPVVGSEPAHFKTRFRPIDEHVIGEDTGGAAMVHVRVGLLTGRTTETKQQLGKVVLEQAGHSLTPVPGLTVSVTVEVFDMDRETYQRTLI